MYRRVACAAGAVVLLSVALPALPASAAAVGTATLAADGVEVLPGATTYEIAVANTESRGLLGNGGRTVNAVRVILPSDILVKTAAVAPTVPGWSVIRQSSNGLEAFVYKAETGGGIAPSGTFTFPVPASVTAPFSGDRTGAFQVQLSSDAGATFQTATGALSTTIRTLQVQAVNVVGDARVTDGTGTAKQTINTVVSVKNFAGSAQTVTASLAGTGSGDTITPADAKSVPAGTTSTFTVPVTLAAVTSDTNRTYTASASAAKSSTGTGLEFARQLPYTIQAAPTFNLVGSTFAPTAVRRGISYAFKVTANKVGTPTLGLATGNLTLKNRTNGTSTSAIPLAGAVDFVTGAESKTLTFTDSMVGSAIDGRYDALFGFTGTDGNGAPLDGSQVAKQLLDILSIDNLGPNVVTEVVLPTDRDGDRTTAARDFVAADANSIIVRGTSDDINSVLKGVVLECVVSGTNIQPAKDTAGNSRITTSISGGLLNYSAVFEPTFGSCGAFKALSSFEDLAGNVGEKYSANLIEVDNTVPTIQAPLLFGAVARYNGVDPDKSSIMVSIQDNTATTADGPTGVIGGCDPRAYSVDGQLLVQAVFIKDEGEFKDCTVGVTNRRASAKPDNNERYLRLTSDVSRGAQVAEPSITYDPARSSSVAPDRIKDAAGNYAPLGVQDTLNRLVPAAPVLVEVLRNKGSETAYFADDSFWTRFSGAKGAEDLTVTASGGLTGDVLELVSKDGKTVLNSTSTNQGRGTVPVPVAALEGTVQEFAIRFLSPANVAGDLTPLRVVFDATAPLPAGAVKSGNSAVASFNEAVIGGNEAINWTVFESVEGEQGQQVRAFRGVNSVSGAGKTRTLTADFTSNPFGGALYNLLEPKGYEDYAGNLLKTTTEFVAP